MADKFNFDVFLSHNGKDKPAVENIARLLRDEHNLKAWLDKWNLIPGEVWQEALEDALDDCQTFAVFLGPSGIGPWENEEMRSAISDRVQDKSRRVIPVLLPGAPDNKDLDLPRFLKRATWVDFRSGLDDKEALYRLYCGITGQIPGDIGFSKPDTSTPDSWNLKHPYPMPPNFTGRLAERAILTQWLNDDSENRLFILRALGGFGKSALTWHWLTHDVDPKVWKKVIFWSFYEGDASFESFVKETLEYLKIKVPQGGRTQVDELLKALQKEKVLLIMDGFERLLRAYSNMDASHQSDNEKYEDKDRDCVDLNVEHFLKSICSIPNLKSKALMTTRMTPHALEKYGQFIQGCIEKELKEMQREDAVQFFRVQGVHKGTNQEIADVCKLYGFHPLSLRLLVGHIMTDFKNAGDIKVAQNLKVGGDITKHQNHILEISYSSLPLTQQKLLSLIACFRSSTKLETLESIVENKETLENDLHDLMERGVLQYDDNNKTFDLHPIVRRFAYERLADNDRMSAHEKLSDYFDAIPTSEKVEKIEDLTPVIELYHHIVKAGKLDVARVLFKDRLHDRLYYQFSSYRLIIELLILLFLDGEEKLPRLKNETAQAWTLTALANSYANSGQPHRAILLFEKKNELREKMGDKKNLASGLGNIAINQLVIGAFIIEERNLRRGVDLCREIDDVFFESYLHKEIGLLNAYCGKWESSQDALTSAIKIVEERDAIQPQSLIWLYRSLHYYLRARDNLESKKENIKSTIESVKKALQMQGAWEKIGNYIAPNDKALAYWLFGAASRVIDDLTFAETNLSKAFNICRKINYVMDEANILLDFAKLRYTQKKYEEAKSLADEALTITERCGYVLQGADVNLFLSQYALEQERDKVKAKEYAETALKLAYCDGPPYYYKVAYHEAEAMLEKLK